MGKLSDMQVCMVQFNDWEAQNSQGATNWNQAMIYASFKHVTACEFIFYLGRDSLRDYRKAFTDALFYILEDADHAGYKYVCVYA